MKKIQILLVSLLLSSYFLLPTSALAVVTGVSFGGKIHYIIPCTCSGGAAVFYSPLYINSSVPTVGSLYYSSPPSLPTVLFSWYNPITPTVWNLGKFIPGVQECWVPVGLGCVFIPTLGSIIYEGTSGLPKGF